MNTLVLMSNLPYELINQILMLRPRHPTAKAMSNIWNKWEDDFGDWLKDKMGWVYDNLDHYGKLHGRYVLELDEDIIDSLYECGVSDLIFKAEMTEVVFEDGDYWTWMLPLDCEDIDRIKDNYIFSTWYLSHLEELKELDSERQFDYKTWMWQEEQLDRYTGDYYD